MNLNALVFLVYSLCIGLGGGQMALAADIKISSGEHEDFSRLVLRFSDRVLWQFGLVDGGFEFRAEETEITYLLNDIFRRIPRDRIKDVMDLGDGRLFVASDCDCHADAFDLRGSEVVLDIKDGPPLSVSQPFNQSLPDLVGAANVADGIGSDEATGPDPTWPAAGNAANASVLSIGTASIPEIALERVTDGGNMQVEMPAENPRDARNGLPLFLPSGETGFAQDAWVPEAAPATEHEFEHETDPGISGSIAEDSHADPPETGDGQQVTRRVAETETALLEQIGRAAAQGLLSPDVAQTQSHIRQANDPLGQSEPEDPAGAQLNQAFPDPSLGPEAHVVVQTSIDRANQATEAGTTLDGEECPDDKYFNVASWGGNVDHGAQLGTYRMGLLGEFDMVRSEVVLALVRYYIYLAFGAESTALVKVFEPDVERTDFLLILSEIMDSLHSESSSGISRFIACDGKVALWAALAQEDLASEAEINGAAIAAAFSELPLHLRRYLGPTLATRLIAAGKADIAKTLRNAIDRASGDHGTGLGYLDAQLAIDQNQPQSAIDALDEVVTTDADLAPEAIRVLIEYKIENDIEITEREIAIAASHAFELRGTDLGQALVRAEIRALAETASFSATFTRFDWYKSRGEIQPDTEGEILAHILKNLILKAQDAVFLRYMIGLPINSHLPRGIRYDAALRLASLGFHLDAREILSRSAQVPNPDERRLFASIALAEGKFDVTLGYLAGLNTSADDLLRGRALAGKADPAQAALLFERAGAAEDRLRAAWRAGDWEQIVMLSQAAAGQASRLMLAESKPAADTEASAQTLGDGAALLAESEEMRGVISLLLSEFSMPQN
ncbi:MAG: hypothetical protein GY945_03930 [Rhodobacteraceae bacterium]|nr:hypothetical protein [Paracoccaceae bacterium]